jgi:hypothetical protein
MEDRQIEVQGLGDAAAPVARVGVLRTPYRTWAPLGGELATRGLVAHSIVQICMGPAPATPFHWPRPIWKLGRTGEEATLLVLAT